MDRVVRIIGVAIVVALPIWAYRSFDRAVSAEPTPSQAEDPSPSTGTGSDATDAENPSTENPSTENPDAVVDDAGPDPTGTDRSMPVSPLDIDGNPPRTLAFDRTKQATTVLEARIYRVDGDEETAPSSRGRRRSVRRTEQSRSDYPIETDLVAGESLAPVQFIQPGLYTSGFDAEECSYELRRSVGSGDERSIGRDRLLQGRLLVSINAIEPDLFASAPQCRSWTPWSPLVEPLVQAPVGDYWIGDLAKGTWGVPERCLWEKVVAFRGARLADVTESGRGPKALIVDEETLGVRIRDCDRALVLIDAEPAPGLGLEPGLQP